MNLLLLLVQRFTTNCSQRYTSQRLRIATQTSSLIVIVAGDYSTNEARNKQQLLFLTVAFGFGKETFNPFHKMTASESTEKRTAEYRLSFEQEERKEKKCNQKQLEEKEIERSTQLTAWRSPPPYEASKRVSWPRLPFRFYSPNETCLLLPYNSLQLLLLINTTCNSDISLYFSW